MEADFSGWATKAGLKCADGRTIMPGAFQHMDGLKVPLVWMHGHTDIDNVLGHVLLESREEGVYAYGFLNETGKAKAADKLEHKDIDRMSIWANELIERSKRVMHGMIREVSLVLSGANPGAVIENVTIRHSDDDVEVVDEEAVIQTGIPFDEVNLSHAEGEDSEDGGDDEEDDEEDGETIGDIVASMSEKQRDALHYMLGQALKDADGSDDKKDDDNESDSAQHSSTNDTDKEGDNMSGANVFEQGKEKDAETSPHALTHSAMEGILGDAMKAGSLKDTVEAYALQHGITNIDELFPEAKQLSSTPEWDKRRTEWVAKVLGGARKSPFSRVRTMSADLTLDEARAKGYVKGTMKREEFFAVQGRVTTPTTIYKKQKLDRDDILDITDFNVVAWLKGEMRLMLDEELARAILVGDGRDVAHDDKINEGNIRPIATDHEMYTTTINVNLDDANSSFQEVIDAIVMNRRHFKGTGLPTMFTSEIYIAQAMLMKDTVGRRIYKTLDELAAELRVESIVPVEILEAYDDIVAILVNMSDYNIGTDAGGQVTMFDDFDIDYNQQKYLIETRCSGALAKLKSAMVVRKIAASLTLVTPPTPAFDGTEITLTDTTGVVYKLSSNDTTVTSADNPIAVAAGATVGIYAVPDTGYAFPSSAGDSWTFQNTNAP